MTDGEKVVYRLYAAEATRENMERAERERFSRATPFYILIYSPGEPPEGGVEIAGKEVKRLSAEDERWLLDCNMALLAEETEKRKPEILKRLSDSVEALETVLRKTKEAAGD